MELNVLEELHLASAVCIVKYKGQTGELVDANTAFYRLAGYKRKDLEGTDLSQICNSKDLEGLLRELHRLIERKSRKFECEARMIKADGSEEWVLILASIYGYMEGCNYVIYSMSSIQKQKENELRSNLLMKRYVMMRNAAGEVPFDLDLVNETILISGPSVSNKDTSKKDTYIAFHLYLRRVHPLEREGFKAWVEKASAKPVSGTFEFRFDLAADDDASDYKWFALHYRSLADSDGRVIRIIGQSRDIEEEIKSREEARRDPLTKLLNKGETAKTIRRILKENPRGHFCLCVIDVDNFKSINDTFGHTYGDNVIADNALSIQKTLPDDTIIGRVGGDEFVALLMHTTMEKAESKANALCHALYKEYSGDDVKRHISASIGISEYGINGKTYEELFMQADRAMYHAKTSGKNQYQIADNQDFTPIKIKREKNEERYHINQDAQQFLAFAVSLMSHARNIDGSLNMLLKRTVDQFGLNHILLLEESKEHNVLLLMNYHSEKLSLYERSAIALNPEFFSGLRLDGIDIIDSEEMGSDNLITEVFNQSHYAIPNYYSVGFTKFEFLGGKQGLICYVSENPDFFWNEDICGTCAELTRMLSIFVSLRFRMDESKAEIRRLQRRDRLTGLYNLEPFKEKVAAAIGNAGKDDVFLLEYMDINNFGYINENYGYKIGDSILKRFADDLREMNEFVYACRIYSDLFVVLYRGREVEELTIAIRTKHRHFANMENYQYPNSGLAISSGLYLLQNGDTDVDAALENAKLAWKKVKSTPKITMCRFYPTLRTERLKEQQVIGEFYESLYRDDFQIYLQPKFDMRTHKIYGAESLVRWEKPNGEVMEPDSFMKPLEQIGFITELDFYMFEELLKLLTFWKTKGREDIICSTNFSGRHFEHGSEEFLNRVKTIMNKYSINPHCIEFEITEGVLITNTKEVAECLQKLRDVGFRIAIDDFGTGYSSLSLLSEIPADVVKMDKSFLKLSENEKGRALLTEFNHLIEISGKEVVFEGVENEEQENILLNCGYTLAQGYLINAPIPVSEFERLYL